MTGDPIFTGVFAFGRECDVYAGDLRGSCNFQAEAVSFFNERDHDFLGGAGIRGAFKNDQLALVEIRSEGLDSAGDVAEVWLVELVKRRWNADDDCVHVGDFGIVGGGLESGFLRLLNGLGEDTDDVGAAAVQGFDLAVFDVEAGDAKALIAEKEGEGKTNISHSDDTDAGLASFDLLLQVGQRNVTSGRHAVIIKGFRSWP